VSIFRRLLIRSGKRNQYLKNYCLVVVKNFVKGAVT